MSETLDAIRPEENKMGTMPVNKLLLTMSLPMVISMLIQALYNVVDSIFVAQISETALTAVSLAFPIQNLIIAIAVGTGVGVNALLSRSLGEKNPEKANLAAVNGIFIF
ncbi:MAG TPA: MATE family efflux transporter, partial [Clostridium sp.]|nr:MATE family efflux transporter [Clostridium sp.]